MGRSAQITRILTGTLRQKKVLTIEELCRATERSAVTVWRILKSVGYYSSFNYNARYYTLSDIPRFDADGLWFYRDVGFSSYGSLTRTLVGLIEHSPMGMLQNELSALLHVRVQNPLYHLFAERKVARVSRGRAHLYVSLDEEMRSEQLRRRRASQTRDGPAEATLTDSETIAILAALVRAPRSSACRIATVLSAKDMAITPQKVVAVIDKYDLRKKGASRRSRS